MIRPLGLLLALLPAAAAAQPNVSVGTSAIVGYVWAPGLQNLGIPEPFTRSHPAGRLAARASARAARQRLRRLVGSIDSQRPSRARIGGASGRKVAGHGHEHSEEQDHKQRHPVL